jgi:hypothetical protein
MTTFVFKKQENLYLKKNMQNFDSFPKYMGKMFENSMDLVKTANQKNYVTKRI